MKVDRELVLHIASLARIELNESEIETFTAQLGTILHYMEKLNEVEETADSFSFSEFLQHSLRADDTLPSLSVEEALKNAPDKRNNFYRVPRIIP
jgi:aspartyl-tRNA(Asn)/glutamyl-tRNA(Gln) amidotransferase subunit C